MVLDLSKPRASSNFFLGSSFSFLTKLYILISSFAKPEVSVLITGKTMNILFSSIWKSGLDKLLIYSLFILAIPVPNFYMIPRR